MPLRRIISGGQTGVDRAALDAAMEAGVDCGGWCPRGRKAEDGQVPARYPLRETGQCGYKWRTRLNVRDADATLIIVRGRLQGGTALTLREAKVLGRPLFILDLSTPGRLAGCRHWLDEHGVEVLNVAGPRESQRPGIHDQALAVMRALLGAQATC